VHQWWQCVTRLNDDNMAQWICLAVDNHELSPESWSNHQRCLNSDGNWYCSTAVNFGHNAVQETWTLRQPTIESATSWFPLANTWTQMDRYYCGFTVSRKTCWQGWQSLPNSVTGNECWVSYSNPKTKWQSMEWHHITSLTKMKSK